MHAVSNNSQYNTIESVQELDVNVTHDFYVSWLWMLTKGLPSLSQEFATNGLLSRAVSKTKVPAS